MNTRAKFSPRISRHRHANFGSVTAAVAGKEFGLYVKTGITGYRVGACGNRHSAALAHVNPVSELSTVALRNHK